MLFVCVQGEEVFMLLERPVKHGINTMSRQSLLFRLKVKVKEPQEKFPFTFEKIEAPEGPFGLDVTRICLRLSQGG